LFGTEHAFWFGEGDFMKCLRNLLVVAATCFIAIVPLLAQQVQTDFDHRADFAQYKTYSWQEIKPANSLWDSRIKDAVDGQLTAKGWKPVASGGDVAIVAVKMTETQRSLQTFYNSFGNGFGGGCWGWRGFGGFGDSFGDSTTTEHDYKEGTLVIDMFDAKTKQLIWRGSAEDMISDKVSKNEKNLNKGVEKMFKDFPPGLAKR
jgi:hypothetical protein